MDPPDDDDEVIQVENDREEYLQPAAQAGEPQYEARMTRGGYKYTYKSTTKKNWTYYCSKNKSTGGES